MPKVLLKDIDPRLQKQFQAADQAAKTNPQYAAELAHGLLQRHPECVDFRRLLRRCQHTIQGAANHGLTRLFGGLTSVVGLVGSSKLADSDPKQAMETAEKMLAKKVTDSGANRMLATAAENLGLHDTAAFAYEELCAIEPKNVANFLGHANSLIKDNNPDAALGVIDKALRLFPGNGELGELGRRASVSKTMDHGKWAGAAGYRDIIKDAGEAQRLEQASRIVNDAASAAEIVERLKAQIEADPENINLYRDIIKNLVTLEDNEAAIEYIRRARATTLGRADASLEKQENDLIVAGLAAKIRGLEAYLASDPANADVKNKLDAARRQETEVRLQAIRTLVDKYPNDYNHRFDYGVLLLADNKLDEAVRELQLAQRSPKHRQAAMLNIGRAFSRSRKYDMAAETLIGAKGEIPMLNDLKKDIIYELGVAYEKSGREKEAIDEYKSLYMADSGYRDVSKKINDYYEKKH